MSTPVEDPAPMPETFARDWRYWRTPVLFGVGFCALEVALFVVRFGFSDRGYKHGWTRRLGPAPLWPRPILRRWLVGRVVRAVDGARGAMVCGGPSCLWQLP